MKISSKPSINLKLLSHKPL